MQYSANITLQYMDSLGLYIKETKNVSLFANDPHHAQRILTEQISSAIVSGKISSGEINIITSVGD